MTQDNQLIVATDADHAFEQLRSEVSLLRRAIEGLAAERQAMPDYGPTLTVMDGRFKQIVDWARRVSETPLLSLTPETLEKEIARVAITARQTDRDTIERANTSMTAAIAGVQCVTESALSASDQQRALCATGCITFLATMFLTLSLVELDRRAPIAPAPQIAPTQVAADPVSAPPPMASRHRHRHADVSR